MSETDEVALKYKVDAFPTVLVLNTKGHVLADSEGTSAADFIESIEKAKKAEEDFAKKLAAADLTKAAGRAEFVQRHLERYDVDSALELWKGFDAKDASKERYEAFVAIGDYLVAAAREGDAMALLDQGEKVFTTEPAKAKLEDLRVGVLLVKLNRAYHAKDKKACLALLDEIVTTHPKHEIVKKKDEIKRQIEEGLSGK